jgi:hypothetical protein
MTNIWTLNAKDNPVDPKADKAPDAPDTSHLWPESELFMPDVKSSYLTMMKSMLNMYKDLIWMPGSMY